MSIRRSITVLAGALALSLAVNLFLVGVFAGRVSFQRPFETPPLASLAAMFLRYQTLPRSERAPFRATILRHAGELRATQQALRAAQSQAVAALQATPYDRARMQQAFATVREATQARQAALHAALVDAIGTLPPDARSAIAGASGLTQP